MANEVVVTFGDKLKNELTALQTALPKDLNRDRFIQNSLAALNSNPDLKLCTPSSLIEGLVKGAMLNLDFAMKECYLIPYGKTATFQTDYKGEQKFVKQYSIRPIKDIYAELVRKDDEFERWIEEDGTQHFKFRQKGIGNSDIIGVFAVCQYEDGGCQIEVMSIEDVQAVRNNYSKQSQGKTWKASFGEMTKKVCLRRLCKHINTSFESAEMRQTWEEASGMEFTSKNNYERDEVVNAFADDPDDSNVIDSTATEITEDIEIPECFK